MAEINLLFLVLKFSIFKGAPSFTLDGVEIDIALENCFCEVEALSANSLPTVKILLEATLRKVHELFELAVSQVHFIRKGAVRQGDSDMDDPIPQIQLAFDDNILV